MTASKAIIEKEYQPRVVVSKTGPNPFNKFTDQDLEEYRKEVELKQKVPEGKNTLQNADQHISPRRNYYGCQERPVMLLRVLLISVILESFLSSFMFYISFLSHEMFYEYVCMRTPSTLEQ